MNKIKRYFREVELSIFWATKVDNVDIMCWDFVSDIHESPSF